MTKKKQTPKSIPKTEIKPPTTIKLTKTQRELFIKTRTEIAELMNTMSNYLTNNILAKKVDDFIEELKIDVVNENWDFDGQSLLFRRKEKKK